jgi:hypothetical protein
MASPGNSIKAAKGNGPMMVHGIARMDFAVTLKSPALPDRQNTITGQTLDKNGSPVGGCLVRLFYTGQTDGKNNVLTAPGLWGCDVISDVNGNYVINIGPNRQFQLVAYLPGSPDVAGVTVNTLTGS